ncbi:MAG: N-acetyltransferase [Chloroflexota bacterium]
MATKFVNSPSYKIYTTRRAEPTRQDGEAFADLVMIAAADAVPQLFGSGAHTLFTAIFLEKQHAFSYDKVHFLQVGGQIAGMISCICWPKAQVERKRSTWLLLKYMRWRAWRYLLGIIQLYLVGLHIGECYRGECYLQFVALYPQFQGRGLGHQLMQLSQTQGYRNHCQKLALDVDSKNRQAIRLYQKTGFEIVSKSPTYPHPAAGQVYRMVKLL